MLFLWGVFSRAFERRGSPAYKPSSWGGALSSVGPPGFPPRGFYGVCVPRVGCFWAPPKKGGCFFFPPPFLGGGSFFCLPCPSPPFFPRGFFFGGGPPPVSLPGLGGLGPPIAEKNLSPFWGVGNFWGPWPFFFSLKFSLF